MTTMINNGNLLLIRAKMKSKRLCPRFMRRRAPKNRKSVYEEETMKKKKPKVDFSLVETEGRRQKVDRRQFTYLAHIPERRYGKDRRSAEDFGSGKTQRRLDDAMANLNPQQSETKRE
jgi:hypothetical protein